MTGRRDLTASGLGGFKSLELTTAVLLVLKHSDGDGLGHTGNGQQSGELHRDELVLVSTER